jgi:hypothetical protein
MGRKSSKKILYIKTLTHNHIMPEESDYISVSPAEFTDDDFQELMMNYYTNFMRETFYRDCIRRSNRENHFCELWTKDNIKTLIEAFSVDFKTNDSTKLNKQIKTFLYNLKRERGNLKTLLYCQKIILSGFKSLHKDALNAFHHYGLDEEDYDYITEASFSCTPDGGDNFDMARPGGNIPSYCTIKSLVFLSKNKVKLARKEINNLYCNIKNYDKTISILLKNISWAYQNYAINKQEKDEKFNKFIDSLKSLSFKKGNLIYKPDFVCETIKVPLEFYKKNEPEDEDSEDKK